MYTFITSAIFCAISVTDWSQEHVLEWLQQLSPALSDLYGQRFVQHSIIGELNKQARTSNVSDSPSPCRTCVIEIECDKAEEEDGNQFQARVSY